MAACTFGRPQLNLQGLTIDQDLHVQLAYTPPYPCIYGNMDISAGTSLYTLHLQSPTQAFSLYLPVASCQVVNLLQMGSLWQAKEWHEYLRHHKINGVGLVATDKAKDERNRLV